MKTARDLAARLPWLVLGVGLGALAVWQWRGKEAQPSSPAPEPAAAALAAAPHAAPVADDPGRARRVGEALARIKPGMTRREVEAILGPPDLERPQQFTVRWRKGPDGSSRQVEVQYLVYYASAPQLGPGAQLMTVEFDSEPLKTIPSDARVIDVSGPHTLDDSG
jgi:SmpA/OmlA family protein